MQAKGKTATRPTSSSPHHDYMPVDEGIPYMDEDTSIDSPLPPGNAPTDEDSLAYPATAHGDAPTQGDASTSEAQAQVDAPFNGLPNHEIRDESEDSDEERDGYEPGHNFEEPEPEEEQPLEDEDEENDTTHHPFKIDDCPSQPSRSSSSRKK